MTRQEFEDAIQFSLRGYSSYAELLRQDYIDQREALTRVEAERDELQMLYRSMEENSMGNARELVAAQAQLVEAVGLLKHVKDWFGWGDLPESLSKLDAFLARHAHAEQQEGK